MLIATNLIVDQLNQLKFSLMGNNYSQKQMMDTPVKLIPKVSAPQLREKHQVLIFSEPQLLEVLLNAHPNLLRDVVCQYLGAEPAEVGKFGQSIVQKIYWKSERVLDVLLQVGRDSRGYLEQIRFRKLMSVFRNVNVARMAKFLGYQYAGCHFIHSLALKPFFASSYKGTIFFLS